jgi:hypothetical protein
LGGKADRAEGLLRLRDTDTSLVTFRTGQLTLGLAIQLADRRVLVLEIRKKHDIAPKIPRCSGPDSHNEQTPALKMPLQTELRFHSRGYEQPPHRRACGTTNSEWLTADHSSSDDLRVDAAATRPLPTFPLKGRGQAIKAKEPETRNADGANGLVGGEAFSSCHHLSTDSGVHLPTTTAPANAGRTKVHRQVLTPVLANVL